jgi:hypothetical protein
MLWRIIGAPTATSVRQMLAAMAQFDKAMTVAKLRLARDPHPQARDGKCAGRKSHAEERGRRLGQATA